MADILSQEEIDYLLDISDEDIDNVKEKDEGEVQDVELTNVFKNITDKQLKELLLKMKILGAPTTQVKLL